MSTREYLRAIIRDEITKSTVRAELHTVAAVTDSTVDLDRGTSEYWSVPCGYPNPAAGDRVVVLIMRAGPVAVCRLPKGLTDG